MRLADRVGLPTSQVERSSTLSGLPFLIVERYDRDLTQEPIRRLHQEDLCQALGRLAGEKYQQEGGPTVSEAIRLIDDYSTAPARDRPQFWSALVFNVLIGNCDAHGKNYSFLYDSPAPSLAPLYDLVSTAVYGDLTTRLAMSINGALTLDEVSRSSWDKLAVQAGVAPRYVQQRFGPFVEQVRDTAIELARSPEHSDPVVREIVFGLNARAEAMLERPDR
jgi:serine/threonine-protein kinase HipA